MPTPRRGTVVLQTGTVTAVDTATTLTVGGVTYTVPHVTPPAVGDDVWVLWAGRSGLVLGVVT